MTIFVRGLLSFWLSTLLTLALAALLLFSTGTGDDDQTREIPLPHLEACAARTLQRVGQSAASPSPDPAACPPISLFYPTGVQLAGSKPQKPELRLLVKQAHAAETPLVQVQPNATIIVFSLLHDGQLYQCLAWDRKLKREIPIFFWLHLVSAIGISALVFWLLARQFSNPILSLQAVAEKVTGGNLAARPPAILLQRKDELGELSRSMHAMIARISKLMVGQRAFLAQASHELGSPLTRLNLALALLRRKALPEFAPELGRLEYEAHELNSMIQQLLLLARLENATEHDHTPHRFSIAHLIEEVVEDARFEARQSAKGVSLGYQQEALFRQMEVPGYRDLLKRAFDNVLRNAIRFTPEGELVEVECSTESPGKVKVRVRDSGMGVPGDQLEAIFAPFVRVAPEHHATGVGLGLAIARKAVFSNGGAIYAALAEPRGLIVTIELPTVIASADALLSPALL